MKRMSMLLIWCCLSIGLPVSAQNSIRVLSVNLPQSLRDNLSPDFFEAFEAQHTGVRIVLTDAPPLTNVPSVTEDVEAYLDYVQDYVTTADVVFINQSLLNPITIEAQYLLNIAPLAQSDPQLDEVDFFPAMLPSFQWQNGMWGLPTAGSTSAIAYDAERFDQLGLMYPSVTWSLEQFGDTVQTLQGDSSPQTMILNPAYLIQAWSGEPFHDGFYQPNINTETLAALLDGWVQIERTGALDAQGNPLDVPLVIGRTDLLTENIRQGYASHLFPMNKGAIQQLEGYSVSHGTRYPQLAYALISYISRQPDLTRNSFGVLPARPSILNMESAQSIWLQNLPVDVKDTVSAFLMDAQSASVTMYHDYVLDAMNTMIEDGVSASIVLADAQEQAQSDLETARSRQGQTLTVDIPAMYQETEGRILRFGMQTRANLLINADEWQAVLDDFAASEPDLGLVALDQRSYTPEQLIEQTDCFYAPQTQIGLTPDEQLLNLMPLIQTDSAFNEDLFFPSILAQFQQDGGLYAYPIDFAPYAMVVDTDALDFVNAAIEHTEWTSSEFDEAMRSLLPTRAEGVHVLRSNQQGNRYLLMMIASYGGLPIDYRFDPPRIDFVSEPTVQAIQTVLDYARSGAMSYSRLIAAGGGGGGRTGGEQGTEPVFYAATYSQGSFLDARLTMDNRFALMMYPESEQYYPLSYQVGGLYISALSDMPMLCYRLLRELVTRPYLFDGLPVQPRYIEEPFYAEQRAFYEQLLSAASAPQAVNFPQYQRYDGIISADEFVDIWFNQAMDRYVFDNVPLLPELESAQDKTEQYLACVDAQADRVIACIESIDPDLIAQVGIRAG